MAADHYDKIGVTRTNTQNNDNVGYTLTLSSDQPLTSHIPSKKRGLLMSDILKQLQPIFQDILDLPDLHVTPESNANNVEDWDSLAHINLVTAIERHFKIKFALGELQELKNVGDMVHLIQRKLAAK